MEEHVMNDTEQAARRLFAAAVEDIPPAIDLLRGVRARSRARTVRVRALVSAGTAAVAAAATAITLLAAQAPSALAQVTQAAARTAGQSYRISSSSTLVSAPGAGAAGQPLLTASGEFDPVRGVGEVTSADGIGVRYLGGWMYLPLISAFRAAYDGTHTVAVPAGKSWLRLRVPPPPGSGPADATVFLLTGLGSTEVNLEQFDPQDLLALLESATGVREVGPASGPGWTGTAYAFSASLQLGGTLHLFLSTSGTVDVDQQGRVRQLDATETTGKTVEKVQMTFGDFGVRVSVSAPPASQTFTP
jgi:hypothetical protein